MTRLAHATLLLAALSAPLALGITPAIGGEAAVQPALTTIKSDRGGHSATAQTILASISAESGD